MKALTYSRNVIGKTNMNSEELYNPAPVGHSHKT